ncbi:hypothetical protein SteCoe_22022 [Stentor coeruleus]|uniref:Uncharacterized protein n=1 Tax=Stentor coeruleus TaxID=5963 RepID=A0A1R2BN30_9CILI|nr:hypothetical protein SteCoe_22022 [Stentor coeruleus]
MENPKDILNASLNFSKVTKASEYAAPMKLTSQSLSPKKNLDSNGLEKFYITQDRKNANREIEIISNRINQLIKVEEKAKKKIEMAHQKAELIQKAKERKTSDVKDKELYKEIRKIEEEELRRKNREDKDKRFVNIKNLQDEIFIEKRRMAEETKKKSKELENMKKDFKMMVEQQKAEKKNARYGAVVEHKQRKDVHRNYYTSSLKEEYEKRIADEKAHHLDLINKKKELEKYEAEVIQRLANTEQNQVAVLKHLETLAKVSLFHLGIRP